MVAIFDPDRASGGSMTRFKGLNAHGSYTKAALPRGHLASTEARTVYPKSVIDAAKSPRLLVSGHNNIKLGAKITRGAWAGMPIFQLTLEERATCPQTCHVWAACYGNAMPFARRHRDDGTLVARLSQELQALSAKHDRFAVRLHVLGDFFSEDYAHAWLDFLYQHKGLHIWGYTAWPYGSAIAELVSGMNQLCPDRCVIRFSQRVGTSVYPSASTMWGDVQGPGILCPQSDDKTHCCGTCGMCWADALKATPIVFKGHGTGGKHE